MESRLAISAHKDSRLYTRGNSLRKATRSNHGYTVLELVIVIILLSFLIIWALIPTSDNTLVVEAARQDIARAIRYTQSLAMASQQRFRINLGQNANTYSITYSDGSTFSLDRFSLSGAALTLPEGVTLSHNNALPNHYIIFDGLGIPYTDNANTPLASQATVQLSATSAQLSLNIYPQTGAVYP